MMILPIGRNSDSQGVGYTWDQSWSLPYESIRSLIHKFAALNRISLSDCKKLFISEDREGAVTELGCRLSLKKLTEIIGLDAALDRNFVHTIVHPSDRLSMVSPYLRECPTCGPLGFHGIFHQVMSITKCPIHQIDLAIATCPACGAREMYDSMRSTTGKYAGDPYACAKCGNKLWHLYDDGAWSPQRNLLSITVEQHAKLDALYDWLVASAQAAPYGASLARWEGMSGLLSFPPPIGMLPHKKSIFQLRGHEVIAYRGMVIRATPPATISKPGRGDAICSVVRYGVGGREKQYHSIRTSFEPQFDDSRIICSDADKALQQSLNPVYKSIRRHFDKVFLRGRHRKCARLIEKAMWWEPGPDSNTEMCPWAFSYLFWRRYWEKQPRTSQRNRYVHWKHFFSIKMSDDDRSPNEWASLRVFALECYWTFQECVLLARGMCGKKRFQWDFAHIRGRLLPYWHIDNQSYPGNPSIAWWNRQPIHSRALRLNGSLRQHRKDVSAQAKVIEHDH